MRTILLIVAGLALIVFLGLAVVMPQMATAELKSAAQALIAGARTLKDQVTVTAEKSGSLAGAGKNVRAVVRTDPKHGELKWIATANGAIRAWNERNAIEIALTPEMRAGRIDWVCTGYPHSAMPEGCGRS